MNSNLLLSGILSFLIYLGMVLSLLIYFNYKSETKTVGKTQAFDVSIITEKKPEPKLKRPTPEKKPQNDPVKRDDTSQKAEAKDPKRTPPKALSDLFEAVAPSKAKETTREEINYKSSYKAQRFERKRELKLNSIKDVTITAVNSGEIENALIEELKLYLHKHWNPPTSVGVNSAKVLIIVKESGDLIYKVLEQADSPVFNNQLHLLMEQVTYFKPVEKELRIETILRTKE